MWPFKKDKSSNDLERPVGTQDRLAARLAGYVMMIQTLFSQKMNGLFLNVSPLRMKRLLIVFCVVTCLLSSYYIIEAFQSSGHSDSIKVEQTRVPRYFDETGELPTNDGIIVDEESIFKVQLFRKYLDSLKIADPLSFDSIQTQRPGLMDSIAMIESLYHSQKLK